MRPVLKWAGGKARLAAVLDKAFGGPCEGTYFEPFVGSAAVYLHRREVGRVSHSVLSDVNAKLIETHKAVRDGLDAVLSEIEALPADDWRERYYEIRERFNAGPWVGPAHAARFIWLNRAGYNGLYRENRKGKYNVPVGRYARLSFPSPDAFARVADTLRGVELSSRDFVEVIDQAGAGDQVYCDPPYVPLSATANFTGYSGLPFGMTEQRLLAKAARGAAARGARVVLSNHDLPVVREELYDEGFELSHLEVTRAISRNGAGRGRVGEIIAVIGPKP